MGYGAIIGRQTELNILRSLERSREAQLLAVYGRRRIGKTYLISQYFGPRSTYFEITGAQGANTRTQLFNFAVDFGDAFLAGQRAPVPASWAEAFDQLRRKVQTLPTTRKIVLFFDELPWLASARSGFLSALGRFWNRYASRMPHLILVICGSAAAWMIDRVISHRGGLHGRVTKEIRLLPFTLAETEEFLASRRIQLDRRQLIELYMAVGGVAQYLTHVEAGRSSAQIIDDLCFSPHAPLALEFNRLYASLFARHTDHIKVVRALARRSSGMTMAEILSTARLTSGGRSSRILEELVESAFVSRTAELGKTKRDSKYRLVDEYSLFYLRWIERRTANSSGPAQWTQQQSSPAFKAWAGYAFEGICLKHVGPLKEAIGIGGVLTSESAWRYHEGGKAVAQIDLIIDRNDHCINLCEAKFLTSAFKMTKDYADRLNWRRERFREATGTKKTLYNMLITTYGLQPDRHGNPCRHTLRAVDNTVTSDALFN